VAFKLCCWKHNESSVGVLWFMRLKWALDNIALDPLPLCSLGRGPCCWWWKKKTGHDPHGSGHGHVRVYAQLDIIKYTMNLNCPDFATDWLGHSVHVAGQAAKYTAEKWTRMAMASMAIVWSCVHTPRRRGSLNPTSYCCYCCCYRCFFFFETGNRCLVARRAILSIGV
jgi:hypothetical protein